MSRSLPSTPAAEAVARAGRAISGLMGGAGRQSISEETEILFDSQDIASRSNDQFPADTGGDGGGGGGLSSASSSDSSRSDSSDDSRSRRSHKRRKKRRRRGCDNRKSKGSRRYSGITDVLDLEFTDDDSTSPPPTRSRKTQASKFVQDTPDSDIEDGDIILKKEDFGIPGTTEYRKNMTLATEALETSFGVTGEGMIDRIGGEQDGDQKGFRHVQRIISDMNHRVDEAHKRCKAFDLMDICNIAGLKPSTSSNCKKWFDETETNMWTDSDKLTLQQVTCWQYALNTKFSKEDRIASRWLKEFIYNSSTDALRSAVGKKYDDLEVKLRGGVIYAYLTLREMFEVNRDTEESMKSFLAFFKKRGVAHYPGENVVVASTELLGVCKRLASVNALTSENVHDVLTGLSICNNTRFKEMFSQLARSKDLGNVDILPTIRKSDPPEIQIDKILEKAVSMYSMFCKVSK